MKSRFTTLGLFRTLAGAGTGLIGGLAARPARLMLRNSGAQHKAFVLATLTCMIAPAFSATAPNSPINNTANASYSIGATNLIASGTANLTTAACIAVGVNIELLQYIPPARAAQAPASARTENVQPTGYSSSGALGGPFTMLPNPTMLDGSIPTLPQNMLLAPLNNPASAFSPSEPIFVRVTSYDSNSNPALAETVVVTLTTTSLDSEVLQLTETGPSTGVFVGVVPSASGVAAAMYNGTITTATSNETITGTYTHTDCAASTFSSTSNALVDPYGIIFDAASGLPVNGATIRLVNTLTGLDANVLCDDGSPMTTTPVISGSPTNCDGTMIAGGFRFPQVAAGSYNFVVTPPAGNAFPSSVPAASLPSSIGTPSVAPVIWGNPTPTPGGSYGGVFTLWGPALKIDIPVDTGISTLSIQKSAGKTVVGTGDFVPYTLVIANNTASPLASAQIADHLPPGFRYQKGSARQNGVVMADPLISADARTLTFSLNIAAASTATVRYVLEVTPGARTGTAENTAAATGGLASNTARASVVVTEDLYRNKAFLIGRVIDGSCDDKVDNDERGLANARIVMEDGTYILTDQEGRWHIDNLRAGTHVVQLDLDSLPRDYEVVACEENTRFAGRSYSQFVNIQGGTMWRADFHVHKRAPETVRITQILAAEPAKDQTIVSLGISSNAAVTGYSATVMLPEFGKYVPGSARLNGKAVADPDSVEKTLTFRSLGRPSQWQDEYSFAVEDIAPDATIKSLVRFTPPGQAAKNLPLAQITLQNHAPASIETSTAVPVSPADLRPAKTPDDDPARMVESLPYDSAWLSTAQPGADWLHPQESFVPALPVIKAAVKLAPGQNAKLRLNGEDVDPLYYEGVHTNAARTVSLASWNGIHLMDGDNRLELVLTDASGKEILHESRNIRYTVTPDRVEFVPEQSRLIADGKTRPIIAVRFLDKDGYKMRRGINGDLMLNEPYRSYDRHEGIEREPLAGRVGGNARYEVKSDGLAMIELEPTTQTGEAVLKFQFGKQQTQEIRAWLEPGQRDWILVGFGEGTLGHKTLSGNIQTLKETGADQQLFDDNKLAFYAKGSIRGDYLMTIAYDTAKETGNTVLKQAVDPTQYYTLYADATQANFDAASTSKLYVKLERKQFYAMFGDFDTGLTVTELSRYSRTLNGVKSEYRGEKIGYNAFATVTSQAYVKDEIPGNGTSGVYKLSRTNLLINSDKVRIETRDRFQSQNIISSQSLTRYLDYDIDYNNGTLNFREPIMSRDGSFNPVYIVAEYESDDTTDQKTTFGGRGSYKPANDIEVGATLVHEGTVGASGNLKGVDATYHLDDKTSIRAEVAATDRVLSSVPVNGSAWLGEVTHHEEQWDARAFLRDESGAFGMGQQAASENATRKVGVDGRYKLSDVIELRGQAYQQENLTISTQNNVLEGLVNNIISNSLNAHYGARTTQDRNFSGNVQTNQLLGGVDYTMLDRRLSLHGSAEISGGNSASSTMPDRLIMGADYKVSEQSKLFAEQEFARGEVISANTTRVGIRTQPWMGNEMAASVGSNNSNDEERLYSNLGMVQRWQIDEHWQTNFSVDRTQTLHNTATPLNLNTPLPSGSGGIAQLPSAAGDYTASAVSLAYNDNLWSGNGRIEIRNSSIDHQQNLLFGAQRTLDRGRSMAAGFVSRDSEGQAGKARSNDLRFSYAHRPNDSQWVWFDRADYITQSTQIAATSMKGTKLVNNFNANYMPSRRTQISLQYGAKYVLDRIDDTDYKGYTDLFGVEIRHDLTKRWDVGTFGSVMRSVNSGVNSYAYGVSAGFKLVENMWISAGYNVRGMDDRDFANASYRVQGPYITLRMKIDQDTFGLNKDKEIVRPMTSE